MSNLIPVKRVDKNGRLVTKHVKPQGTAPSAPPKIPMPFMNGITIPSGNSGIKGIWDSNMIARTKYTVADFDQGAIAEVERLLDQSNELGRTVGMALSVGEALDLMAEHGINKGFHNLAVFGKHVLPHTNLNVTPYVTALHELFAPREIDFLLEATPEERRSAEALVEFTVRAEDALGKKVISYSNDDPEEIMEFTSLRDPLLTQFILDSPDSIDGVLDILIAEDGPVPVDVIRERLAHSEKALSQGIL